MVNKNVSKNLKVKCMELTASKSNNATTQMSVKTKGLDCFDDSTPISVSLDSSGTIVVHDCDSIFLRSDEIVKTEEIVSDSGIKYTRIWFKNNLSLS